MNIVVCVSQVPDTETRIKIAGDGKSIEKADVNFILNPYDELAVEQAIRLKEAHGGEVTVVSVGDETILNTIRKAIAMGADKAVHIKSATEFDGFAAAKAIAHHFSSNKPDIILTGKESVDTNSGQFSTFLAVLLDMSVVNVVVKLDINGTSVKAEREIEGGKEIIETSLPVVISCQKGLNEPRLPTLKGIMASKSKKPEEFSLSDAENATIISGLVKPPAKPPGKIVGTDVSAVSQLVDLLQTEAKVI